MNRHKVYTVAGVLAGAALLTGACAGTASAMASGNGGHRSGTVQGNGFVKAGEHNATWSWRSTWGNQVGADHGNGYVKAGEHNATWSWRSTWGNQVGADHGNGYVEGDGYSASWSW